MVKITLKSEYYNNYDHVPQYDMYVLVAKDVTHTNNKNNKFKIYYLTISLIITE